MSQHGYPHLPLKYIFKNYNLNSTWEKNLLLCWTYTDLLPVIITWTIQKSNYWHALTLDSMLWVMERWFKAFRTMCVGYMQMLCHFMQTTWTSVNFGICIGICQCPRTGKDDRSGYPVVSSSWERAVDAVWCIFSTDGTEDHLAKRWVTMCIDFWKTEKHWSLFL